ncbi:hypothetical protein HY251_06465, partial [bacterium]|nr:hypothetical protein [bacterium]
PAMFDAVDRQPDEVKGMTDADREKVVDECYQCKMCYVKCPYTPPHSWQIDFPRLMLRADANRRKKNGIPLREKLLGSPERAGAIGRATWPFSNVMNEVKAHRWLFEKLVGVHRDKKLPEFAARTFEDWFSDHRDEIAREIERGERPRSNAGRPIVALQPTCGYVLKSEYVNLLGGDDAKKVASKTMDVCEYLMKLETEGKLEKNFPLEGGLGTVSYHLPCHLQAQNIGFKSRDLLRLIPKTRVVLNEKCTAHDGTWAMKTEHFHDSLRLGKKSFDEVDQAEPRVVASDCPLAAIQLEQGTGRKAWHPIQILDAAYRGEKLESPADATKKIVPPPLPEQPGSDSLRDVQALTADDIRKMGHG